MTNVYINGKVLGDYEASAYVIDELGALGDDLSVAGLTIAAGDGGSLAVYIPISSVKLSVALNPRSIDIYMVQYREYYHDRPIDLFLY